MTRKIAYLMADWLLIGVDCDDTLAKICPVALLCLY
jgi:hypothetical protein